MLRAFLLVFDSYEVTRQAILDYLDTQSAIKHWYAFLPTAIVVISDQTPYLLATVFRQKFPSKFFIISEVLFGRNDGWLPKGVWDFINNPKSSGRWPP